MPSEHFQFHFATNILVLETFLFPKIMTIRSLYVEDDNVSPLQDNFRPPCIQGERKVKRVSVKNLFKNCKAASNSSALYTYGRLPVFRGCISVVTIPVILYMK